MKNLLHLKIISLLLFTATITNNSTAQNVGLNGTGASPNAAAMLDIDATDKGLLIPRLTTAQRAAITLTAPAQGLLVYQTDAPEGFYYNSSTTTTPSWIQLSPAGDGWELTGNTGTISGTNFIGTTDAQALDFRTNNTIKARITTKGQLEILNTGESVFIGEGAGANDNLTTNRNVFIGHQAGASNINGNQNTANGSYSLYYNTDGSQNTANGYTSLYRNTTGRYNTANGYRTLFYNTTGQFNTANGIYSLYYNITGNNNTANGGYSLFRNTSGDYNTANGYYALYNNRGDRNTSLGYRSGDNITSGSHNLILGTNIDAPSPTADNQLNIANIIYGTSIDGIGSILSTGNIGIGVQAPQSKLDVRSGDFELSQQYWNDGILSALRWTSQASSGRYAIGKILCKETGNYSGDMIFYTQARNGSVNATNNNEPIERIRIKDDGNVGIGITTPQSILDVNGQISMQTGATNGYIPVSDAYGTMTWTDPASIITGVADGNGIYDGSGSLSGATIVSGGANTLDFTTTVTDGFSVNGTTFSVDGANDRVGIGTDSPIADLHVGKIGATLRVGPDYTPGVDRDYIDIEADGTNSRIVTSNENFTIENGDTLSNGKMTFRTGSSDRLTILNLGNVGIGTSTPQRTLHVSDVMRLEPIAVAPTSPSKGDMYMDDTTNKLMVYDGTTWQACW